MGKKSLNVRVDEEIIAKMNYFCGVLSMSQSDFVASAILGACEKIQFLRSGGAFITVPNPQNFSYKQEDADSIISALSNIANYVTEKNPSLDGGLNDIVAFYVQRLKKDTEDQKEIHKNNMINDSENLKGGEK